MFPLNKLINKYIQEAVLYFPDELNALNCIYIYKIETKKKHFLIYSHQFKKLDEYNTF